MRAIQARKLRILKLFLRPKRAKKVYYWAIWAMDTMDLRPNRVHKFKVFLSKQINLWVFETTEAKLSVGKNSIFLNKFFTLWNMEVFLVVSWTKLVSQNKRYLYKLFKQENFEIIQLVSKNESIAKHIKIFLSGLFVRWFLKYFKLFCRPNWASNIPFVSRIKSFSIFCFAFLMQVFQAMQFRIIPGCFLGRIVLWGIKFFLFI